MNQSTHGYGVLPRLCGTRRFYGFFSTVVAGSSSVTGRSRDVLVINVGVHTAVLVYVLSAVVIWFLSRSIAGILTKDLTGIKVRRMTDADGSPPDVAPSAPTPPRCRSNSGGCSGWATPSARRWASLAGTAQPDAALPAERLRGLSQILQRLGADAPGSSALLGLKSRAKRKPLAICSGVIC